MNELLEKLRKYTFWSIDFLRKGDVNKFYNEIKFINENFQTPKAKILRKKGLNNILLHAVNTTKYYSYLKNNPSLSVEMFPVVHKDTIRDHYEDFYSSEYKDKQNIKVSTSGSTGTPFSIHHNKEKKQRNTADTLYFADNAGYKLGHKLLYIRFWGDQYKKGRLNKWTQNIMVHNVFNLKDEDIKELIEKLESDNSNINIIAYASAYETICQYLEKNNYGPIKANIHSAIAMSESLTEYAKVMTKKYFGVTPLSRYSNTENGIIAQQNYNNTGQFDINWASFYLEILNIDNDEPVSMGETGRIVVTDLFNYAVPMIRYDTGDLGSMSISNDSDAPVLVNVEGRKSDALYNTKGELISSSIAHQVCAYDNVKQYQLIQLDKQDYLFKLSVTNNFNLEDKLISKFKNFVGNDARIFIEYVNYIPLLSSGKRKRVVNEYKKA
ncbi:phenylacetate--CoA ligase family protein [Urechidicola croceus]|uniref:CoF synthetase n=1 Tax=Urechidicola croceus TaxID=1850246 RepID=A0A1D8P696_9FLAO|nr:phenylacetate--CoA ligase family protein [Urechidicola croceus]AOW20096.1 hypothetical protein LPB138_05105 [Urechidicola croceus]